MAPRIDDVTKQKIKRSYLAGEGSQEDLAARFQVSVPTVRRITKGLTPAQRVVKTAQAKMAAAIADADATVEGLDLEELLRTAITNLGTGLADAPIKSRESAVAALANSIRIYRDMYPLSMEEAADWVVNLPGFDPVQFVQILREKWQRSA